LTEVTGIDAYLDIMPDHEGFNHIALFSSASSDTPRFLTSGPWEVDGKIQGIDAEKGLMSVFFHSQTNCSLTFAILPAIL
jgi:hypothetical protein